MNWLKESAKAAFVFVAYIALAICVVGLLCGAISVVVYGYRRIQVAADLESRQPEPPAPVVQIEPVRISLHGPQPRLVIAGVATIFTADVTGPANAPEWEVIPAGMGSISKFGDGRQAELVTTGEGECTVIAAAAGDGRQLAKSSMLVTSIPQMTAPPPAPASEPPPAPAPSPVPPAPQVTIAQATLADLSQVTSANRPAEAQAIGGTINMVAGRINGGYLSPNMDVVGELKKAVQFRLQEKYANWDGFMNSLAKNLVTLRSQGVVYDSATTVRALQEIASVLLQDR